MNELPKTRSEAMRVGSKRYFTGSPCKHGHLSHRQTSDGCCITCRDIKTKAWDKANREKSLLKSNAWKERNKAYLKKQSAEKYAADPEKYRKQALDSYYKNKESRIARARTWKEENKDHVLKYAIAYAKSHREQRSACERNRNARKRSSEGTHTAQDVLLIISLQRGKCAFCKKTLNGVYHVDHVIPLALDGSNGKENIQVLCPKCNLSKNKKHPITWAQEHGRLL